MRQTTTLSGIILMLLLFSFPTLHAQVFPYAFSTFVEDYEDLGPDAITVNNGQIWDNPYYVVPIGFEFNFYGQEISDLYFNGVGGGVLGGDEEVYASPMLFVYGTDILDRGYFMGTNSESPISYTLEGSAPNRVFKLEWKNVGFWEEFPDPISHVDFQLWLYESSNNIEIRFGPNEIFGPVHGWYGGPFIGFYDPGTYNIWSLTGSQDSPEIISYYGGSLEDDPENGRVYHFEAPPPVTVTFHVDMTKFIEDGGTVSSEGIHITGDFQNWDPTATPMNDNGDGTWSYTTELLGNFQYQYKYINGTDWVDAESLVTLDCGVYAEYGIINRVIELGESDIETIDYCFNFCYTCDNSASIAATFNVDMTKWVAEGGSISPEGLHIAGNFQDWNPGSTPMTDNGDGTWSYSTFVTPNSTLQYKFINGTSWDDVEVGVTEECGVYDGYTGYNRVLEIGESNVETINYCFGYCTTCDEAPESVNVTFHVDMNNFIAAGGIVDPYSGVFIMGDFQGWVPWVTPMIPNGDNTWSYTTVIDVDSEIGYIFACGPDWFFAEPGITSECGIVGPPQVDYVRFLEVPDIDFETEVLCYNYCITCGALTDLKQVALETGVIIFPNPVNEILQVQIDLPGSSANLQIQLFNGLGQVIREIDLGSTQSTTVEIGMDGLPAGLYHLLIRDGNARVLRSLVKQ